MKRVFACTTLCLVLIGAVAAGQTPQQRPPAAGRAQTAPDMKASQEAMARHDQMMKEMETMDARLRVS